MDTLNRLLARMQGQRAYIDSNVFIYFPDPAIRSAAAAVVLQA